MTTLKNTYLYDDIIKEFNYPFGDLYLFKGFVISEIKEGVIFSWENHAKKMVEDISEFAKTNGENIVYISHRVNSYSVIATDWVKFFKHSYSLKGYGVVGYTNTSFLNTMIENLFFKNKIKRFRDINAAVEWATSKVLEELSA
jgi:hypothetical protein